MAAIDDLLHVMRMLRDPKRGCPWDRAQNFASIAQTTLEEAYEVVDAIESGAPDMLRDELGDLLFQVVFHAQMAAELNQFDFDAVAASIRDKLVRRHPHVFAGSPMPELAEQSAQWERMKAAERAARHDMNSELDGVARCLPALARAVKLSRRAARVGFDWEHAQQTAAKVSEELGEVLQEMQGQVGPLPSEHLVEEVGDLLFAAANLARKLNIDAESALRAANAKFERRFHHMEAALKQSREEMVHVPLARLESLWETAKQADAGRGAPDESS